jgi:hypothetical protein
MVYVGILVCVGILLFVLIELKDYLEEDNQ